MFKWFKNWNSRLIIEATRKYDGSGYGKRVTYEPSNIAILKLALLVAVYICLTIVAGFFILAIIVSILGLYSLWLIPFVGITIIVFALFKSE